MEWKYVKPLKNEGLISDFEQQHGYRFPESFKAVVRQYNGGRPELRAFDTESAKERYLDKFLSFNTGDWETIWMVNEWNRVEMRKGYVAFAMDAFGNLICFDKKTNAVVFMNMDDLYVEKIADSFEEFLGKLYI